MIWPNIFGLIVISLLYSRNKQLFTAVKNEALSILENVSFT